MSFESIFGDFLVFSVFAFLCTACTMLFKKRNFHVQMKSQTVFKTTDSLPYFVPVETRTRLCWIFVGG